MHGLPTLEDSRADASLPAVASLNRPARIRLLYARVCYGTDQPELDKPELYKQAAILHSTAPGSSAEKRLLGKQNKERKR